MYSGINTIMAEKRKVTVYIDGNVWKKFLRKVLDKRGMAAGGAISEEVESAIKKYIR